MRDSLEEKNRLINSVAWGLIGSFPALITGSSRLLIDIAMFFGLLVIVAMALNFQYGNAGIPNMGCAVQVIIGAFTVSAVVMRITFEIVKRLGVELIDWYDGYNWVYNNPINVSLTNAYLKENVILAISIFLFSISLSMILGSLIGYLLALPALRLRATYLMIVLITMADASQIIGRNVNWISGGTIGVFVPDIYIWYPGDRGLISAVITLFVGTVAFLIFRTMLNSPYGRLMRAMRENEVTVGSVGKNIVEIRRNILMFASAITAIAGVLNCYYLSFVQESGYQRSYWTYWPWLMLILGGPGNNAGTYLGCALVIALRRLIIVNKYIIEQFFFFPVTYLENLILGLAFVLVMIFRPNGLIPEKLLYIPGINYTKLVQEDVKVDWREHSETVKEE